MGDRMLEEVCLRCGTKLIADYMGNFNKWHCCSSCSEWLEKSRYEASKGIKKGKRKKVFQPVIAKKEGAVIYIKDIYREPDWVETP